MITAARQQKSDDSQPRRDISPWVLVAITVIVYIVTVAGLFASVRDRTESNSQQIHDLQQNTVTRREMDDVKKWLEKIDGKLDRALEKKAQ
jgi:flagellar biosynthesis/type III secretory pathway M-ring protein FliF/YscJ